MKQRKSRNTTSRPAQETRAKHIQPKTLNQDRLLTAIESNAIVIGRGSAGTGKTYIAVNKALNLLLQGKVKTIVLTRPNMPTGRSLGMFPGSIQEKIEPWLAPMISIIKDRMGNGWYDTAVRNNVIQLQPVETVRGCSWDDAVIIADEAQNFYFEELKAITTRLGQNTKLILIGDPKQRDTKTAGLDFLAELFLRNDFPVPVITFTSDDVVRSDIVGQLVKLYERENL